MWSSLFCSEMDMVVSGVDVLQKLVSVFCFLDKKVSSIYLLHSIGGLVDVLLALVSKSSIKGLVTWAYG